MIPRELYAVVAAVALCQVGVFYLQTLRCERLDSLSIVADDAATADLRVLVVSDVHLLGKRRRAWIERAWVDWQIKQSVTAAVAVHQPDLVLVLGDQFDEGSRPTPDADWQEYVHRLLSAFESVLPLKTLHLVGNHDASFGKFMSVPEIQRYEVAFGPSNYVEFVGGHMFVGLNTMALDSDASSKDVQLQARSFLDDVQFDQLRAKTTGQVVLLTHLPLHREDDMQCGDERRREGGHVTYEHPAFKYEVHHHVLSPELSAELLAKVQPDVVVSGHTHAWCAYRHSNATVEFTVPAFTWGQRPDPSYALLRLRRDVIKPRSPSDGQETEARAASDGSTSMTRCALPHESLVFGVYGFTSVLVVFSVVWRCLRCVRRLQRSHSDKKRH